MPTSSDRGDAYRARNRSLIQLGAILAKSELPQIFAIAIDGSVIQPEPAATLLGACAQMCDWLRSDPDRLENRVALLRTKGRQASSRTNTKP